MKKQIRPEEKRSSEQLLRDSAEDNLRGSSCPSWGMKKMTPEGLLHELRVHQIELEMQNEELSRAQLDLLESRQRLSDLYDFAPVGYFTFTRESLIKEVNLTGATLLGVARLKLINKRFRPFIAPSDLDTWDQHFLSVLWEGEKQSCDLTLKRQDGSPFFAGLESIRVEVSREGFEVHTIVTDITERKQMEEALRKSEEQFKSLYDNAAGGIFQMTPEGRLITANRVFGRMFGYESPEEVIDTVTNIAHQIFANPDDKKMIIDTLKERESLRNYECQMRRKDGFIFWGSINARFTETVDGIPCFEGLIIDVSERRQAEGALRKSETRYRRLVELLPDGIVIHSGGRVVFANPACARIIGAHDPAELTGRPAIEFVHPEYREMALKRIKQSQDEGIQAPLAEEKFIRFDGRTIDVDVIAIPFSPGDPGMLTIFNDITERKQADEKLNQTLVNLRKALVGIIQVVAATVEAKDPYTAGHQRRTADLARAIAGEMGLTEERQDGLLMAGIIHDLGKISIPAEILSKPTKLTEIEYKLIKVHSQVGYDILKNIDFPWPIAEIVLKHHERMNGSGYPQGLKGKEICLEAKILMVADVVEAMASYRPYRPALGIDKALEEISQNKGSLYDPEVVDACLRLFKEKGFRWE